MKRKLLSPDDLGAIQKFENYFKLRAEDSLLSLEKRPRLEKALTWSADQRFKKKEEGKPWKIFRVGTITYYCIGWNDYGSCQDSCRVSKLGLSS